MTKFSQKVRAFISEEDRPMSKKTFRMYLWLLKGALMACFLIGCLRWEERDLPFNLISLIALVPTFVLVHILEKQKKA